MYPKLDEEGNPLDRPRPDLMGSLSKKRWVTFEEAELHLISKCLGSLQKEGFLFAYDGPFPSWPEDYLDSVMAHFATEQYVHAKERYTNKEGHNPSDFWSEAKNKSVGESSLKALKGLIGLKNAFSKKK